ncbi:hypothetical protein QOZ80_3BG0276990 [Eleusine coracana subsp. coracana]|nr:hypothetical protein QOZ80_3BG0276990 [Eleusine coracana subsp. coracana]
MQSDPSSILMDVALYDEDNPIMEWLSNSMSESQPTLDEYDDNTPESPNPSRLVVDELEMEADELASFKRKLSFDSERNSRKKRKIRWEEDEEGSSDDYESDDQNDNDIPIYDVETTWDSSSDDSEHDDDGLAGSEGACHNGDIGSGDANKAAATGVCGATLQGSTSCRRKSKRQKTVSVKGLYSI